jgi:hypothetical protein
LYHSYAVIVLLSAEHVNYPLSLDQETPIPLIIREFCFSPVLFYFKFRCTIIVFPPRGNVTYALVTSNVVSSSSTLVTLMVEAIYSAETSVLTRDTRRHIPEDCILLNYPFSLQISRHVRPFVPSLVTRD